jgi:hypothetical protein
LSFIDPRDFKSVRLGFALTNTTTHTEVKKPGRVQMLELLERGMVLAVPGRFCKKGHYLVLAVNVIDTEDGESEFKTGAKVEEIESVPGTTDERVTVSLLQHDADAWARFTALFHSRQDEIFKFFSAVRGEG